MTQINDWIKYFPLKTPRDEQTQCINFAIDSFKQKKFVIIEAPVGIGKSAIAVALTEYYKNDKRRLYC